MSPEGDISSNLEKPATERSGERGKFRAQAQQMHRPAGGRDSAYEREKKAVGLR